ncbi:MAG: Y-family DNA polymerase [Candidatus Nitrosocosmicus sp.]
MHSQNPSPQLWTGRVIMHVDMNAFFPTCEEIRDSSLKGKPHAVIMTPEREGTITRGAVASCSYEARRYGVRSAMSLIKAKELCPDLILKPVDKQYYSQISNKVMALLEEYTDILEKASIDEAYLDCSNKIKLQQLPQMQFTSNIQQLHKIDRKKENTQSYSLSTNGVKMPFTVEEHALRIKASIKEQCNGLVCSIGVAPTKSAAKIASDFVKPDGLTVVYSHNLLQFLEPLEVNKISGIGTKTNQILKQMGIKTIGQLAKYNVQFLIEKFGKKNGLWMWYVANGKDNEPVRQREDSLSLSAEKTLLEPSRDKNMILEYLVNELVGIVYGRVKESGYEFRTVGIKLVKSNFVIETREITLPTYSDDKDTIVAALSPLLEKFSLDKKNNINNNNSGNTNKFGELDFPFVRKIGIKVSNLSKKGKEKMSHQKTLFDYMN